MIFPIGDDNIHGGAKPFITYLLLGINFLIFIYEYSLNEPQLQEFFNLYGTIPNQAIRGENLYSLITNMFLHGGMAHLAGNMLFLWIFADNVEAVMGSLSFTLFYLVGGIVASLTHIWMNMDSLIPSLGASGAISAVLGTYIVLFPRSRIKMIFIIFFMTFYISALFFIGYWFLQQFLSVYSDQGDLGAASQGVAWWAHIGGFIYGIIVGLFYRKKASKFEFEREYQARSRNPWKIT